jgi:DNA-directed RNA polymerase specialized sigma24 family protein
MREPARSTSGASSRESRLASPTRQRVVRETLAAMEEVERIALALYHYEKLGPEGIAEAMQMPQKQVDLLLRSASSRVRAHLGHAHRGTVPADRSRAA